MQNIHEKKELFFSIILNVNSMKSIDKKFRNKKLGYQGL